MAAPVVVTLRPGVILAPEAAASFARAESDLGRQIDVNSTYRDYNIQLSMWRAWQAYVNGTGPYPGHSRALHPDLSAHCKGLALDSDDWRTTGFITFMAARGWIRTAAGDPTEQHHFEYQAARDQHIGRPAAGGSTAFPTSQEDDMPTMDEFLNTPAWDKGPTISAALKAIFESLFVGGKSMPDGGRSVGASLAGIVQVVDRIDSATKPVNRDGKRIPLNQEVADAKTNTLAIISKLDEAPEVVSPPKA